MSVHRFLHPHYVIPTVGVVVALVGGFALHPIAGLVGAAIAAAWFRAVGGWKQETTP